MGDTSTADERLAGVITRLDIALVLHAAGIDARSFTPAQLDSLSRILLKAHRRGRQAGSWPEGDPL
jgi:hypothetical protein